jgi:hypothetical protein
VTVTKYSNPENRLASALQSARPVLAQQAIDRANENLTHLAGECALYVDDLLDSLRKAADAFAAAPSPDHLAAIYQFSLRFIGASSLAGLNDLEYAAQSLCDVADGMMSRDMNEREPVLVHVNAMRLLRHPEAVKNESEALLKGLELVRSRFAMAPTEGNEGAIGG